MEFRAAEVCSREDFADFMLIKVYRPEGYVFRAGQYADIRLPGIAEEGYGPLGNRRTFSIASAPEEEEIGFAVRRGRSPFKAALERLRSGDRIFLGPAQGSFAPKGEDVVCIAGGIGITPFRSIVRGKARPRAFAIFHLNAPGREIPFESEMRHGAEAEGFRYVPIPAVPGGFSPGEEVRRECGPERTYLLAGPPLMVVSARETLLEWGIPDEAIEGEEFAGY